MFKKLLRIIPRAKLEELARDYAGNERPWQADRKFLEVSLEGLVANEALTNDLVEFIQVTVGRQL